LFCSIAAGEVQATIVSETPRTIAFADINPQAPVHVLVIPRAHHATLAELVESPQEDLLREVLAHATEVAKSQGIQGDGHRIVFNTGPLGGQTVEHVHAHVLGGRQMTWPPG
jgi:histidine triad (HIT) family protein